MFDPALDWPETQTKKRYVVLSAPRTGSTMLCSALTASKRAGVPMEYLNPRRIELYRQLNGPVSLDRIWNDFLSRRTTPNGCFGLKLHAGQYRAAFSQSNALGRGLDFLNSFDRSILCSRRDKVGQAISNILARERGQWTVAASDSVRFDSREFRADDYDRIEREIRSLEKTERFWRKKSKKLNHQTLEIEYEDLAKSPEDTIMNVFDFLGVDVSDDELPLPTTQKLPDAANRNMRDGYYSMLKSRGSQAMTR
ncbi:Stf0 family sulfotransferase [Bauldia sp.]|uniref:Stf0 family sulfotransferase n=1 Tax=Bauldia sp. TaxID=2575872 RepID=UPI003BADBBD6